MAKIRLIGTVCKNPEKGSVGQNNKPFIKYLVEVKPTLANANPRVATQNTNVKASYFAVMAFGKQAEIQIMVGQTIELDGSLEIANFQLSNNAPEKQAAIITPEKTTILQGNVQHFAKAYNVLGNLVATDAEVYNSQNSTSTIYTQRIAIGKRVGDQEFTSFYKVKFFNQRGEKLFAKQLLNKSKVKSILIDGSISATYTTKPQPDATKKEYFNCDINASDFQIASWADKDGTQSQNIPNGQNAYNNQSSNGNTYNAQPEQMMHSIPNIEDINDDEIPF